MRIAYQKLLQALSVLVAAMIAVSAPAMADRPQALSLPEAVNAALAEDPWLKGSEYREAALADEAVAVGQLPDPRVSVTAANLPTDTFSFGQEAMTQAAIGITQTFPRGQSRDLARVQKQQLVSQQPLLRADRRARVEATVTQLWLDVFRAQQSIQLIESDRALFEQLVEVAEAGYASAQRQIRQQDVIRAQVELTRLDDRLTLLQQQRESAQQQLAEWIPRRAGGPVTPDMPELELVSSFVAAREADQPLQTWYDHLRAHPAVRALDRQIDSVATAADLARQKYKPEWGLTAQYGYRDADPMGRDRADLFSLGVTFDLPLFTGNRQDKQVSAAVSRTEAAKTDRALLLRQMASQLEMARSQLQRLNQRQALYRDRLLPQLQDQSEAALSAYTSDAGDFTDAVRARIAELNAKVEALVIEVDQQKTIAQINYLLAQGSQTQQSIEQPQ